TVALDGQAVPSTSSHRHDPGKTRNLHRNAVVAAGSAIAELAVAVITPRPNCAVVLDGQAMGIASRHPHDARKTRHLQRHAAVRARHTAGYAADVVTPRPYRTVALEGQAAATTSRHPHDPG